MIDTDKVLMEFSKQLEKFKDASGNYEQIATLLTTHLYIEYFLNYIIENHFHLKNKILKDNRSYTFSIKLDLVYEKEFIPEWVYFNIRKLNYIRNKFSHNLDFDVLNMDLQFKIDDDDGNVTVEDIGKKYGEDVGNVSKRNILIIAYIPLLTLNILAGYIKRGKY